MCQLRNVICLNVCHCLTVAIQCVNNSFTKEQFPHGFPYVAVSVLSSHNLWPTIVGMSQLLLSVTHINFLGDNISAICNVVSTWKKLIITNLGYNLISEIRFHFFYDLKD